MSERYSRLFSLQDALYLDGAPVIIQAGALLRDNEKQKIIVQLKLKSISEKSIKAITVHIMPLDTAERKLGGAVAYQYLDLNVSRDSEFGEQTPVYIDAPTARSFRVCVTEVVFIDNSIWSANAVDWTLLPKPEPLGSVLNGELLVQYRLDNGEGCQAVPKNIRDLWYCICGACNHSTEEHCHVCTRPHSQCNEEFDIPKLKEEVSARLAAEREEAEKKRKKFEARQAAEAAEKAKQAAAAAKKRKTTTKIAAAVAVAAAVACVVIFVIIPKAQLNAQLKAQYNGASALYESGDYEEAIEAFNALGDYKDSAERAIEAKNAQKYDRACELLASGDYNGAIATFEALNGYKDSADKIAEATEAKEALNAAIEAATEAENAEKYAEAEAIQESGETAKAAIAFGKLGNYRDSRERSMALWDKIAVRETISAGENHTVGLKSDGTVVAVGRNGSGQCNVSHWKDIVAVSAGSRYTVGLKSDGTVVAVGDNSNDVSEWTDIVAVTSNYYYTFGLKSDGTVVIAGFDLFDPYGKDKSIVSGWENIVAISAHGGRIVGLNTDGTAVTVFAGSHKELPWSDIIAVSAGDDSSTYAVGLKSDGTVVAETFNDSLDDIYQWKDIVAISFGAYHAVGLKENGTVVAAKNKDSDLSKYGQCDISDWENMVAVSAGGLHTVGLKSNGTVIAVGYNTSGQCDVTGWTDIKIPK